MLTSLLVLSLLAVFDSFSAWIALCALGLIVALQCMMNANFLFGFLILFGFVTGLAVMFMFFVSGHGNYLLLSGSVLWMLFVVVLMVGWAHFFKTSDGCAMVSGGGTMYLCAVTMLLMAGVHTVGVLLSNSCKTFRPTSH